MATHRSAVPPEKAWMLGRATTIPATALWVGATGTVLNTVGVSGTGTFVLGGITVVATAATAAGNWAKSLNEKAQGLPPMNKWQISYVTTCTCAAGTWITWAAATLPWHAYTAGSLVAGTLAAWLLYPWYRSSRRHVIAAHHATDHPAATERDMTGWEAICDEAGLRGMVEIGRIETPGGYVVRMRLPTNGRLTFPAFQTKIPNVSVVAGHKLGLRAGALRAEPGTNDAEILLHVAERDVLAELIPLPHDMALIDSNEPFDIGLYEDATPMMWDFLRHGMIIGFTDSGKSNTLNTIIKKGGQMVDTLIWVIDPKGGRMIRPWIQPLIDGKVQRPVLDWVATNGGPTTMGKTNTNGELVKLNKSPDEYHYLLDTAIAEMNRRANLALGGEKVHTSPDLPRIVVIIDEATDVLTDPALFEKVLLIARKGRSEGIILLLASQRGTASMFGSGDLRSQILNAIGLGVRSTTDAAMVFPDDPQVSRHLTKLVHQGTMLVKLGARGRAIPGKGYRIDPDSDDITRLAIALSGRRPGLPADAVAAHGSVYTERWSTPRISHLLTGDNTPPPPASPRTPPPPGPTGGGTAAKYGLPPSRILADLGIGPANPGKGQGDGLSAEGNDIVAGLERLLAEQAPAARTTPPATPAPAPGVDARRTFIRDLIRNAGADGITNGDIHRALTTTYGPGGWDRSVITTWITEDCQAGLMHRPQRGRVVHGPGPSEGE
jgi:hypothetical protein